jgi:NAD-dependent DNA ligase
MAPISFLRRLFGSSQGVVSTTSAAAEPASQPVVSASSPEPTQTERPSPDLGGIIVVRGVGEGTVRNLRAAGFTSVETIAKASEAELLAVPGVGLATAARLKAYARGEPAPKLRARPRPTPEQISPAFNASRRIDRAIHEMLGLCRGVLADGIVTTEEALLLANWIEENPDIVNQWPASALAGRIERIFADGVVEPREQRELEALLREITGTVEKGEQAVGRSSTLPLDMPPPLLEFDGWEYVFTGRFASGTRRWCQQAVERIGAACGSTVTNRTNVLVIGTYGSRDWSYSGFGRKIQKAVDYRTKGTGILIVAEDYWSGCLGR